MDKLFIIALIAGGIIIAGLTGTVAVMKMRADTLVAEKAGLTSQLAVKDRELKEAQGDLEVSDANANRMIAERDALVDVSLDRAQTEKERADGFARIKASVAAAPRSNSCADSPVIRAALDGLGQLHFDASGTAASGHLQADGGVPASQDTGKVSSLPGPAADRGPVRHP